MRVVVIVPALNEERVLGRCLAAVLPESDEVIVVDADRPRNSSADAAPGFSMK